MGDSLLYDLFNSSEIIAAVRDTTLQCWKVAVPMSVIFLMIQIGYLFISGAIPGWKWRDIFNKVGGSVVTIAILVSYPLAIQPILGGMKLVARETQPTLADKAKYFDQLNAKYEKEREDKYKQAGIFGKATEAVKETFSTLANTMTAGTIVTIDGIVLVILSLIETLILMLSLYTMYIFYIIGPLALAFSVLPMFRDKLAIWLGTFLTCGFNLTTMNLLDHLFWNISVGQVAKAINFQHVNPGPILCINIVIIIVYCMSFWITSRFVGSDSAGKVLSTGIAGASTLIGLSRGGIKPPNIGGGDGGLADNVSRTGSDSLRKND